MNKNLIFAGAICISLWAEPSHSEEQSKIIFTGQVLPQCSFSLDNTSPASVDSKGFILGNRASIATVCNTGSTLSVRIAVSTSGISDADTKTYLAYGGKRIYAYVRQDTTFFTGQYVTTAIGDTSQIEVDLPNTSANSIVVFASFSPQ